MKLCENVKYYGLNLAKSEALTSKSKPILMIIYVKMEMGKLRCTWNM